MLTFKATLHDTKLVFDRANDAREDAIELLLRLFNNRAGGARLVEAITVLDKAQAIYDDALKELARLEHIEDITNEIVDPFPPHIAAQMRQAGLSDDDMRDIAKEILEDDALIDHSRLEGGAEFLAQRDSAPMRTTTFYPDPAEMPDAPWAKADIGAGTVEYRPGTGKSRSHEARAAAMGLMYGRKPRLPLSDMENGRLVHDLLESTLSAIERSMSEAEDDRPSLHGDGHVGPVARHARDAARETCGFSLHDMLEAADEGYTVHEFEITPEGLVFQGVRRHE